MSVVASLMDPIIYNLNKNHDSQQQFTSFITIAVTRHKSIAVLLFATG